MGAFDLIKELHRAGVTVRADDGMLDISPADRLTDEIIAALKRHKSEILHLLQTETQQWQPDRCDRCAHCYRPGIAQACAARTDLPWMFGLLYHLPEDRGASCSSWQPDRWETICPTHWLQ
jgi:hypothetical protein